MRNRKEIRKEQGNAPLEIGPGSYIIEIGSGGVTIRPFQHPVPKEPPIKPADEDKRFRQAYIDTAASLLNYRVPEGPDVPPEVLDKLGQLDKTTRDLLAVHQWKGTEQLTILVQIAKEDLFPVVKSRGILPLDWERCQGRLRKEIIGSVNRFREEQYQERARRTKV